MCRGKVYCPYIEIISLKGCLIYLSFVKSDTKMSGSINLQKSYNKGEMLWKVEALHMVLISCPEAQWDNSHVKLL